LSFILFIQSVTNLCPIGWVRVSQTMHPA
jgi:hypothetical protein